MTQPWNYWITIRVALNLKVSNDLVDWWIPLTSLTTTTTTTWSNVTWRLHEIVTLLDEWCDLQVTITCLITLLFSWSHEHMAEANITYNLIYLLTLHKMNEFLLLTFKYIHWISFSYFWILHGDPNQNFLFQLDVPPKQGTSDYVLWLFLRISTYLLYFSEMDGDVCDIDSGNSTNHSPIEDKNSLVTASYSGKEKYCFFAEFSFCR